MNVLVLFLTSLLLTLLSFNQSRLRMLSPSFWSSGFTSICCMIYLLTFNFMKADIHPNTMAAFMGSLVVIFVGEQIGLRVTFKIGSHSENKSSGNNDSVILQQEITISKNITYIVFIVFIILAYYRYVYARDMAQYVSQSTNLDLAGILSEARIGVLSNETNGSHIIFNQFLYAAKIISYLYWFCYIYNVYIFKNYKKYLYMLLPVIPDLVLRFFSTGRFEFIQLAMVIVISSVYARMKKGNVKKIDLRAKHFVFIGVLAIGFVIYGRLRNGRESSIISYLQAYTCGALYTFDSLINNHIMESKFWGSYTLQNVYTDLHIVHDSFPKMINASFSKSGAFTNIFTGMANYYLDYGIVGTYVWLLIYSIIFAKLLIRFLEMNPSKSKFPIVLYFSVSALLCFMYWPIGDIFSSTFLTPAMTIRYIIYGIIIGKFVVKIKIKNF